MSDMSEVINYATAPLVQWEPAIGEEPSAGKKAEDAIIYPEIAEALRRSKAECITGVIADEARLELYMTQNVSSAQFPVHLTLPGAFQKAASHNARNTRVAVTTETEHVPDYTQDAVIMNMILGCVSTPSHLFNIHALVGLAAKKLDTKGELIIVRPNPEGGAFDTYSCLTPGKDLKAGQDYDFIVKGLEDLGAMKNMYTPDKFMQDVVSRYGFTMQKTQKIGGKKAPFLLNVCTK